MREQIVASIDKTGNTKIEVKNVKGKSCVALTADIEESLGTVLVDVRTSEYNEQARNKNNLHIEQR